MCCRIALGRWAAVTRACGALEQLAVAVPRFSELALWCYVAIGFRGSSTPGYGSAPWTSCGAAGTDSSSSGRSPPSSRSASSGWWHRRRSRSFLRLAAGEVVVMAATVGLAVALSRTPTPVPDVPATHVSAAHAVLGFDLPPYSLGEVLTGWRPDTLVLLAAGTALALYVTGVRTLSRRGLHWPIGRTLAWLAGLAVVTFVLDSGLAAYGRALFSAHAAAHGVDDDRSDSARIGRADHAGTSCIAGACGRRSPRGPRVAPDDAAQQGCAVPHASADQPVAVRRHAVRLLLHAAVRPVKSQSSGAP